jgi:hypothetical protein
MHAIARLLAVLVFAVAQWSTIGFAFAQNGPVAHPSIPGAAPPSYTGPGWGPEEQQTAPPDIPSPMDLPCFT